MESKPDDSAWQRAWLAAVQYQDFLRLLATRYRQLVASDGAEDADDLLQSFLIERLPRIVEVLEHLSASEQEHYLVASFRNFARSHRRSVQRYQRALGGLARQPSPNEEPPFDASLDHGSVRSELGAFLRSGATRASLRAIADEFGITRYEARKRIVDASLALAVELGESDLLAPREVAVCRLVLLAGLSPSETADALGITDAQVRRALSVARELMGKALSR